jgi:hypothetical protein
MNWFSPTELTPLLSSLLVSVGYILAAISYYIGVTILALPAPSPRVKALGRALIRDGITTAIVVSIFSAPLAIIRLIGFLGFQVGSPAYENFFYPWLGIEKGVPTGGGLIQTIVSGLFSIIWVILSLLIIQVVIVVAISLIATIVGGFVHEWLGRIIHAIGIGISGIFSVYIWWRTLLLLPALIMVPIAVYLLYCIFFFAEFIQRWVQPMILFGALIYGLPFRIGRRVGAALIAMAIVFYLGLPLMPYFVNAFASQETATQYIHELQAQYEQSKTFIENMGYPNVYLAAQPNRGEPGYYLLYITDGSRFWQIWTSEKGERILFLPPGDYRVYRVEYMGIDVGLPQEVKFKTSKTDVNSPQAVNVQKVVIPLDIYEFTLKGQETAQAFVSLKHSNGIHITDLQEKGWGWDLNMYTEDSYSLAFFIPYGTSFSVQIDSRMASFYSIQETVVGKLYRCDGSGKGMHKVSFVIQSVSAPPKEDMKDQIPEGADPTTYAPPELNTKASDELTKFFFAALVIPQFYVWVILVLIAVGVARLLGGHEFGNW